MRHFATFVVLAGLMALIWALPCSAECPAPGDVLYVENTFCQILYTSNSTAQLWCPREDGLYSMTLLTYTCSDGKMVLGDGFKELAVCFEEDEKWGCYQPTPRIATLTPQREW